MRTQDEILAEMDAVQAARPELAGLADVNANTSEVSFFKLLKLMWATLVMLIEDSMERFAAEVTARIALTRVGSAGWYAEQIRNFQYGDAISILNGSVSYPVIDESKKIVKQVSVVEDLTSGRLLIKAVKAEGAVLADAELDALKEYIRQMKYAGVAVDVVSLAADELKLVATCKVDRQVIGTNGVAVGGVNYPVFDAINAYVKALPLNSVLNNTALIDVVQAVPGVLDFTITEACTRRPGATQWVAYTREIQATAGHLVLHTDTVITYS